MEYSICELLFFLFIYSFLGWCHEVLYMAVKTGNSVTGDFLTCLFACPTGLLWIFF